MTDTRFSACPKCGTVVAHKHMARHQKGERCKVLPAGAHCDFCNRPGIRPIFERVRAGELIDSISLSLGVSVRYIQDSRTKGRSRGCLPKSTQEEITAELHARARALYGERVCTECHDTFVPRMNTPDQRTCDKRCQERRKNRLTREAQGQPTRIGAARGSPERLEEEIRPLRLTEAEIAAEADRLGAIIEANREHSAALWLELMGVAA